MRYRQPHFERGAESCALLEPRQLKALEHLAAMVSDELELRLMVFRSAAVEQRMREMVH